MSDHAAIVISPQRKYQIRNVQAGLCKSCRAPRNAYASLCDRCAEKRKLRQRLLKGAMDRKVWNQRRAVRAGGYTRNSRLGVETYRDLPHGPFWCSAPGCGLELDTADGLAHHRELRHEER